EKWVEKQEKLRRTIKQVLPCDVTLANPFNPLVVPPADCVLSTYCLEVASKDLPTYCSGVRNLGSLVKSGGHLVLVMALGGTYYNVGPEKFSCICLAPEMAKEAVKEAGFDIVRFETLNFNMPMTMASGQTVGFLVAQKHQEA
uniref:Uncharacterized protein n=1 Tax=Anolis carolinensis TaxID=28377 RepID=H9G9B1_ANOCA